MIKKIIISPTNTKAIAFFDELNKKKEAIKKKLAETPFTVPPGNNNKIGK